MKLTFKTFLSFLLTFPIISHGEVHTKFFKSNFENTWRGLMITLSNYPLEENNQSLGSVKTPVLAEGQVWTPLNRSIKSQNRYVLNINVNSQKLNGKDITLISIEKELYKKKNFLENKKILSTQGVEENLILYRVGREIHIDKISQSHFK